MATDALALVSARQMLFELRAGMIVELASDLPPMSREVCLIMRQGALLPPAVEVVLKALRVQGSIG